MGLWLWLSHSAIQSSKEQFKGMLTKSVIISIKACSNAGYEITYEILGYLLESNIIKRTPTQI